MDIRYKLACRLSNIKQQWHQCENQVDQLIHECDQLTRVYNALLADQHTMIREQASQAYSTLQQQGKMGHSSYYQWSVECLVKPGPR
jgi:hypothetical protein